MAEKENATGKGKGLVIHRSVQLLAYAFSGVLIFGALLDAISNAIEIVRPMVTYALTILILLLILFQRPTLNRYPILWRLRDGRTIRVKHLGVKYTIFLLGVMFLLWLPRMTSPPAKSPPSDKDVTRVFIDDSYRPAGILPQAFYLHSSYFPFIQYYPFDLHLGLSLGEFNVRHSGITEEFDSPIEGLRLYGLKENSMKYDKKRGRINELNTFFLFHRERLASVMLSLTFDPTEESVLAGRLDRRHPLGVGERYHPGAVHFWLSEDSVHSEVLVWIHGYSSGENTFVLTRNDFLLNDLTVELNNFYDDVDNLMRHFPEFRHHLEMLLGVIAREEYDALIYSKFNLGPVALGVAILTYTRIIDGLAVLGRVWDRGG